MSTKPTEEHLPSGNHCPHGMVQMSFVGVDPSLRRGDYRWAPSERAFLEIYVDGELFQVQVGTDWKGRRGLHINGPFNLVVDKHSINAVTIAIPERLQESPAS